MWWSNHSTDPKSTDPKIRDSGGIYDFFLKEWWQWIILLIILWINV